jgi:hypothetical protein
MDVVAKFLIVTKHRKIRGKNVRRRFNEEQDLGTMVELAIGYAKERGEDFLIVQVIAEVSKPKQDAKDLPPQ